MANEINSQEVRDSSVRPAGALQDRTFQNLERLHLSPLDAAYEILSSPEYASDPEQYLTILQTNFSRASEDEFQLFEQNNGLYLEVLGKINQILSSPEYEGNRRQYLPAVREVLVVLRSVLIKIAREHAPQLLDQNATENARSEIDAPQPPEQNATENTQSEIDAPQPLGDDQFVKNFCNIYTALYTAQKSLLKTNFVKKLNSCSSDPSDRKRLIEEHIKQKPDGRSKKACDLMEKYQDSGINSQNQALLKDIYLYGFEKSHIFSCSQATGLTLFGSSAVKREVRKSHVNLRDTNRVKAIKSCFVSPRK